VVAVRYMGAKVGAGGRSYLAVAFVSCRVGPK